MTWFKTQLTNNLILFGYRHSTMLSNMTRLSAGVTFHSTLVIRSDILSRIMATMAKDSITSTWATPMIVRTSETVFTSVTDIGSVTSTPILIRGGKTYTFILTR